MSGAALGWAWRQPVNDALAKLLLVKLADQANDDGECWPSRRTLAADCGCSSRTVTRHLTALQEAGYLSAESRARENGGRTSNLYVLRLEDDVHTPLDTAVSIPPGHVPSTLELELEPRETSEEVSLQRRDPVWDFVVKIEGEPLNRHRAARGRIVSDLRTLLSDSPADELERRHEALAREWGDAKATARALVQHWDRAGRMANGQMRPARGDGRISADDLFAHAMQLQQRRESNGT